MKKELNVNLDSLKIIENQHLRFEFLPTGDLFSAKMEAIQINQVLSNELDGAMNNIYLRVLTDDEIKWQPLLGSCSDSLFSIGESSAKWQGSFRGIDYSVVLSLQGASWFWELELSGNQQCVDVVYTQDLGLAELSALQANEAYVSQYIDHKVLKDENGFKICSRQNQAQPTGFPYIQQGVLGDAEIEGYSTDGFQFFGKSFKFTGIPEKLNERQLSNSNYQYEFSLIALKTQAFTLKDSKTFAFYGHLEKDLPYAVKNLAFVETIRQNFTSIVPEEKRMKMTLPVNQLCSRQLLNGEELTQEEMKAFYPVRNQEEHQEQLLSFFTDEHHHVVLAKKEAAMERPHGNILLSGNSLSIKNSGMATTSYIYGLFNSQIVLGNTTMNKWLTNQRNHLNFFKVSGQRIYVKMNGSYHLLNMPSVYEMGFNYTKWIYKIADELFIVKNFVANHENAVQLELTTKSGKTYDFLLTNQVIMNDNEFKSAVLVEEREGAFYFKGDGTSEINQGNPALTYQLTFSDCQWTLLNNQVMFDQATFIENSLAIFELKQTQQFKLKIKGALTELPKKTSFLDFQQEKADFRKFYQKTMNGFSLKGQQSTSSVNHLNTISWWYTHNMLIHYLSPHGLEQYGGAAWGTRDVCQGPIEYFLATQNFSVAREILLEIFAHQLIEEGNWPQWFMFDDYSFLFSGESHGDVIVWPLMAMSQYLEITGDQSILEEQVPFMSRETNRKTSQKYTIQEHLDREINYIRTHFLFDTHLSMYGDGDWDDTLQPANQLLKKQMASTWTVALTYQAFKKYGHALELSRPEYAKEMLALSEGIKKDYQKYMLATETLPGFVYMHDSEKVELMIHPTDTKSSIHYRLLPMTRSMIGELLEAEQAQHHYEIIKNHLTFNDGVRLMNKPAPYAGGVSVNFKRAEQAANFGREVGLLYVHAQIRFVEAMCKYGKGEDAWEALNQVVPINLVDRVANALPRQSNTYFSSSDGDFATRYEAQANFNKLKAGEVGVKGGWRLYSSGPGIFMNQLITNVLGIRKIANGLILDPVIVEGQEALTIDFKINENPVQITLVTKTAQGKRLTIDGTIVDAESVENRYRQGGFFLSNEQLAQYIQKNTKMIVEI